MSILIQILVFLAITFLGCLVVNLFLSEESLLEKISLGFLAGLGIFTFVIFLVNFLANMPFRLDVVVVILIFLIIVTGFLNILFKGKMLVPEILLGIVWLKRSVRYISLLEKILFLTILYFLVSVFINDIYWPVWQFDAIALYDYQAKKIFATGSIVDSLSFTKSVQYPLFLSLGNGLIYLFNGINAQYLYFLFYLTFTVIFYFFVRRFLNRAYSLISTLLIISVPVVLKQSQYALASLPQSTYLMAGFFYLALGLNSNKKSYLILSATMFALSTWIRNEPFWIAGFIVLLIFSFKKKLLIYNGIFAAIVYLVKYPWNLFLKQHALVGMKDFKYLSNAFQKNTQTALDPLFWINPVVFVFQNVIGPLLPIYISMILLFIIKTKDLEQINVYLTITLVILMVMLVGGTGYFMLTSNYWPALFSSLQRLVIFINAIAVANVVLLLFPWEKKFIDAKTKKLI